MLRRKALFYIILVSILGSGCVLSTSSRAGEIYPPIASTACDPLYYESLSARAWLEAQREITQNQNIILKPDSVLEYTCFDLFAEELAQHARNMLSETTAFGGPMSDTSMDGALQNLVGISLDAYGNGNFGHGSPRTYGLLGGRTEGMGIGHDFTSIAGGAYTCNIMDRVWQAAKCINFASHLTIPPGGGTGTPTDGFFTFQEYADSLDPDNLLDKRHRPTACTSLTLKGQWVTNLTAAYITPPWTQDPVQTYIANITAPTCGGSPCKCQINGSDTVPIPTGVRVNRPGIAPNDYDEKICIQPGCRYNPQDGDVDGDGSGNDEGCYAR